MRKLLYFLLFCSIPLAINAQITPQTTKGIIEELNTDYPGQGHVVIYQEEAIKSIVGRNIGPKLPVYSSGDGSMPYVKIRGFKIQAFSGNNQRSSKDEAYRKQALINQAFPEQETTVLFESPFWRLRVGNFKSREDASAAMREMRRTFPAFGKEMYIVTDEVKIPIDQLNNNAAPQ
ncbi:MAG: SPOR domain-containing protein [Petrimonas sp.]|nr:SPOR domain-containing protein [Petrimonas sp.]